ncbi:lactate transporter (plasmid) [Azospirillum sp. B510]|uniref:L-lactate permease n=1 Tax=Azospirillum sp. (strain B510) TaxID=137722 RepID=UPI0001C4CF9E|nr:L-lactate permease [Azospirillum sp. B510]BAI76728.1 lactate transporter [Azospirillum sp. B510]
MSWSQVYDPMNNIWLSTLFASLPVLVMLGGLGIFHMKAHRAALLGLATALAVAVAVFGMPVAMAGKTALLGAAYGLLPIGWIVINIIFLYHLTEQRGQFKILQESITGITNDRRLQLLLIAFCFGAFFEGAAGFGTPVAVTGAMLIGLGFTPLAASGLSLIANTAPVAYGALGTPVLALAAVTGLPLLDLSAMIGRQLPFFSVLVPFWLIVAFAGWRGMIQIWPAILVAGVSFAVPQYLVSNYHGPWLVDVAAAIVSLVSVTLFLKVWHPKAIWHTAGGASALTQGVGAAVVQGEARRDHGYSAAEVRRAWTPWAILSILVFLWGIPEVKTFLDGVSIFKFPIDGLHNMVMRVPPVVAKAHPEAAVYTLNWLSATGTGIFIAAVLSGLLMGYSPVEMVRTYGRTLYAIRNSLLTISAMLALGYTTRYSGLDTTLGLAFANSGFLYPFFGTFLGWLGVALTGSDTASNVLFGSLQKVSSEQLGLPPVLMAAANSSGGVMGKMIDAQSIVVAAVATKWHGHEGKILRFVIWHSLALTALVGLLVMAQAYLWPFTALVIGR